MAGTPSLPQAAPTPPSLAWDSNSCPQIPFNPGLCGITRNGPCASLEFTSFAYFSDISQSLFPSLNIRHSLVLFALITDYFQLRCAVQAMAVFGAKQELQSWQAGPALGGQKSKFDLSRCSWTEGWQQLCPCSANDGVCESEQTLTTSQNLFEMHFLSLLERERKKK